MNHHDDDEEPEFSPPRRPLPPASGDSMSWWVPTRAEFKARMAENPFYDYSPYARRMQQLYCGIPWQCHWAEHWRTVRDLCAPKGPKKRPRQTARPRGGR